MPGAAVEYDRNLKAGDTVYIEREWEIVPAIVIFNDQKHCVVEYKTRNIFFRYEWDQNHIWHEYGYDKIIRE